MNPEDLALLELMNRAKRKTGPKLNHLGQPRSRRVERPRYVPTDALEPEWESTDKPRRRKPRRALPAFLEENYNFDGETLMNPEALRKLTNALGRLMNSGSVVTLVLFFVSVTLLDLVAGTITVDKSSATRFIIAGFDLTAVLLALPFSAATSGVQHVGWIYFNTRRRQASGRSRGLRAFLRAEPLAAGVAVLMVVIALVDSRFQDVPVINYFFYGESPLSATMLDKPPAYWGFAFLMFAFTFFAEALTSRTYDILRRASSSRRP